MPTDASTWSLLAVTAAASLVHLACVVRRRPRGGADGESGADVVSAVAVAVGFACGHLALTHAWSKPWTEWELQPFWVTAAALPAALLVEGRRRGLSVLGHGVVVAAVAGLVIWPGVRVEWEGAGVRTAAVAFLVVLVVAILVSAAGLARRRAGPSIPWVLVVALAATAVLAWRSNYATFALLAAVLLGVLLPAALGFLWRRGQLLPPGVVLVASAVLVTLLLGGYFHTFDGERARALSFVLVGLAPSGLWLGVRSRGWAGWAVSLVLVAAALALAWGGSGGGAAESPEADWEW